MMISFLDETASNTASSCRARASASFRPGIVVFRFMSRPAEGPRLRPRNHSVSSGNRLSDVTCYTLVNMQAGIKDGTSSFCGGHDRAMDFSPICIPQVTDLSTPAPGVENSFPSLPEKKFPHEKGDGSRALVVAQSMHGRTI
ncbi:hypothetical protein [Sphaerotilus natans]|nr:hypothetical protein [Sphaerotilus natans]